MTRRLRGLERGATDARKRFGLAEPEVLTAKEGFVNKPYHRGRLAAIARYGDEEQRRRAIATLRAWKQDVPDGDAAAAA